MWTLSIFVSRGGGGGAMGGQFAIIYINCFGYVYVRCLGYVYVYVYVHCLGYVCVFVMFMFVLSQFSFTIVC